MDVGRIIAAQIRRIFSNQGGSYSSIHSDQVVLQHVHHGGGIEGGGEQSHHQPRLQTVVEGLIASS